MELPLRLAGAVWGHLVGDAVGVPYEFLPSASIGAVRFGASGTHGQRPGTWSDDGALMLALLDSLLAVGIDPADQGRRFLAWRDRGAYTPDGDGCFDIGNATSEALRRLRSGVPAEEAGPSGEYDNGNGSLMRILPLALVGHTLPEAELIEQAHRASRVTHGHPVAQAACALYVLLARELLLADESEVDRGGALERARETLRVHYLGSPGLERHRQALETIEAYPGRSGSGYVVDALWSAWDAFENAASYGETIERAVRYGDDTDTTACIAGGLAGAWFGLDGIPADWRAGMRGRDIVEPLVDRLIAHVGWRTSGASPIRVNWIEQAAIPQVSGWRGRLGMTLLPGKKFSGYTGDHWRDLAVDAARLHELGVDSMLLLVEDQELRECQVPNIVAVMADHGIEVVRHPVADLEVPVNRDDYRATLQHINARLRDGRSVAVACRGGLGRTGTAVACLLVDAGLPPDDAIALTRRTRHGTIERGSQEAFVRAWPST